VTTGSEDAQSLPWRRTVQHRHERRSGVTDIRRHPSKELVVELPGRLGEGRQQSAMSQRQGAMPRAPEVRAALAPTRVTQSLSAKSNKRSGRVGRHPTSHGS